MNYWKFSLSSLGLLLLLGCSEPKATGSDWVRLDMTQFQSLNWNSVLEEVSRLPLQAGDAPSIGTCHKVLKYQGHYYLLAQIAGGFYHIYIYDEDIPPARVYSPSLKSADNAPAGCSSLQAEIFFANGSNIPSPQQSITTVKLF